MACPIHSPSGSPTTNDSVNLSGTCMACLQHIQEDNHESIQCLEMYDHQLASADDSTQQSSERAYWLSTDSERDSALEPTHHIADGDSTKACRAYDHASSTDTQTFDTPTSSSDRFGTPYVSSRQSVSYSGSAAVSWDGTDTVTTAQRPSSYSLDSFLNDDAPWSAYNLRMEPAQDTTRTEETNNDENNRGIDPSYRGCPSAT